MDYEYKTNFMYDFAAIDEKGEVAIRALAQKLFDTYKDNIVYLTELIMVINHRSWYWYNIDDELCDIYTRLYYDFDEKAINYLEEQGNEENLSYFFRTLD